MAKDVKIMEGFIVLNESKNKFLGKGTPDRYGKTHLVFKNDWRKAIIFDSCEEAAEYAERYFQSHKEVPYWIYRIKATYSMEIADED